MATHTLPAIARLKEAGHRITEPRKAIIAALRKLRGPVTAEELLSRLKPRGQRPDIVTVYRNITALEKVGLLRRTFLPNGKAQFSYTEATSDYFIVSNDGGRIEPLDVELSMRRHEAAKKIGETLRRAGFTELSHVVQFRAHS